MTEDDPIDRLSAKRQFVLVLHVVVQAGGKVSGELVDPVLSYRRPFREIAGLVEGVRTWLDAAIADADGDKQKPPK